MAKSPKKLNRKKILADLELQTAVAQLAATGIPLDTQQSAIYLGLSPGSLEVWRSRGCGPKCIFVATRPRYLRSDLDAWIATSGRRRESRP
jgi:hypothetical protein